MTLQEQNFIALLGYGIGAVESFHIEDPSYPEILTLAELHGVTGFLYPPLKKVLPFGDPVLSDLKKQSFSSATRDSLRERELTQIYSACTREQIPVLPLKGSVIKALYPHPELRHMSDADLLIREEDGDKMRTLMESLGHTFHKVDAGDTDVFVSPVGLNYEIHRGLAGEGFSAESRGFASGLLEYSRPKAEGSYLMELPWEEHYIYILCHFIKHFIYGGVGVRQLCDLYICYTKWDMAPARVDVLLDELGLKDFHAILKALWEHWFRGGDGSALLEELGTYILHSGVFGNEEQRATDRLLAEGSDRSYVLARLFPPYQTMKAYFPVLKKLPVLLPAMWGWRAVRAVLFRRKKLAIELNAYSSTDKDVLDNRRDFYRQCGLSVYQDKSYITKEIEQ